MSECYSHTKMTDFSNIKCKLGCPYITQIIALFIDHRISWDFHCVLLFDYNNNL